MDIQPIMRSAIIQPMQTVSKVSYTSSIKACEKNAWSASLQSISKMSQPFGMGSV